MTTSKRKASVITAVSGAIALLMLWEADERLNGSKGKAWLIGELRKNKPVNIDEAKAWLERTPLYPEPKPGDKDVKTVVHEEVEAVVKEGISRGLLQRIWPWAK